MSEPNANPNDPPLVLKPDAPQQQGADTPRAPENEPPLVTRPTDENFAPPPPTAPPKPRPGFWEAALWAGVFVAAQMFGAIATVTAVFTAYALAAPDPKQFVHDQFEGFTKATEAKGTGERPPVPFAFAQALAWGMLAAQITSLGLILLVFPRRIGPDWKRQLGVRRPHWLHVVLVLLMVPGFLILSGVIDEFAQQVTGLRPPEAMKALNSVFGPFPWPLTLLAVSIGPGVVEELWCRGFLGRGLCARYGILLGVLCTSVFFSAMHLDPSKLVVIVVMGAFLHFVYLASRSIWVSILLHVMNNGVAIILVLTLKPEHLDAEQNMPVVLSLAALALLIFGSVALWTSRARLQPLGNDDPSWYDDDAEWVSDWQPEYPGISAPPPGANVRIGYAPVSPVALVFTVVSFAALIFLGWRFLV